MSQSWTFVTITEPADRQQFDCGIPELNEYLQRYARQNHTRGIAKTFVAVNAIDDRAKAFYLKYGFIPLENLSLSLFLPVSTLQNLISR
jgi:hypothetical protein